VSDVTASGEPGGSKQYTVVSAKGRVKQKQPTSNGPIFSGHNKLHYLARCCCCCCVPPYRRSVVLTSARPKARPLTPPGRHRSFFPPFRVTSKHKNWVFGFALCCISYYWVRWDEETESEMDAFSRTGKSGVESALVSSFRVNLLMKVCVRLQNRFSFVFVSAHGNRKATAFLHCRAIR